MAPSSLATIQSLVEQGKALPDYIAFVIKTQQARHQAGKVKSIAGAVFTAITKQHLVTEYASQQQKRPSTNQLAKMRHKLLADLEDARKSLAFVLDGGAYTAETRPKAEAQVRNVIGQLEAELAKLG